MPRGAAVHPYTRFVLGAACLGCGRESAPEPEPGPCASCGGNLDLVYDYRRLRSLLSRRRLAAERERGLWRYAPLLPVARHPRLPLVPVGGTPLFAAPELARALGLAEVYVKDDGRNPSASLKDRASAVAVSAALALERRVVATASTGNAASSLACLAAGTGLKAVIFVPASAPEPKLAQSRAFGAELVAVDGNYDAAFALCARTCRERGWYDRSTGLNPLTREGKKTCAFELCEQLDWEPPDWIFVPAGDGNILSGLWKGLRDFRALGLIDKIPRLAAVQAAGSAAIVSAVGAGGAPLPCAGRTAADSIAVCLPRDGRAAVRAVRESGGLAIAVPDRAILAAVLELARLANVFAEPAGAAALAGACAAAASGQVKAGETAVLLVTGNGLKDPSAALRRRKDGDTAA